MFLLLLFLRQEKEGKVSKKRKDGFASNELLIYFSLKSKIKGTSSHGI